MKRLVVCCDGTWNVPDRQENGRPCPTNVVKLAAAIPSPDADGIEQRVYYHQGVGTGRWDHLTGGAFGVGLSRNIRDAYRFLVEEFEPGDELYLFGFSRGAYTARSLAGLIRNSGLLRRDYRDRVGSAFHLYRRRDSASHPAAMEATLFRATYAHETRIHFIGVWDTVGSLGIPTGIPWLSVSVLAWLNRRWAFHDVQLSSYVDCAYHAVAIDEHRKQFAPTLWQQQPTSVGQVMEQAWFAGVHTNVGGGDRDSGLSDIALLWMIRKAVACGLEIDLGQLQHLGTDNITISPNVLGELHDSRTGLYRLFRAYIRPIGQGKDTNEAAHAAAVARMDAGLTPPYFPSNLVRYRDGGGTIVDD